MNNYFTGKTVDEAVALALNTLGISQDEADITVIEEASKGIFGIGAHPAKVLVIKKEIKTEVKTEDDDLSRTVAFLEGLFDILKTAVSIETSVNEEDKIVINLMTANSSSVIGYRGEVLDSIQFLASAVYNSDKDDYQRVVVDCENYRDKRNKTLTALANRLAQKAIKTGRKICLEPMNPFERRIIHSAIANVEGIKTESEGKEPNRYVAIIPDGYDPTKEKRAGSRGGERRFKNGFDKGGKKRDKKGGDRRRSSSSQTSADKPKKTFGAGVYLGNSLKDKE